MPKKQELIDTLTSAFGEGDLEFIEKINNLSYSYKVALKAQNRTTTSLTTHANRLD